MRRLGLTLLLAACSGGGGGGCRQGPGGGGDGALELADANNYSYTADLDFGVVEIAAQQDATIDWSQLTTDIRGRTVDPASVEQLLFVEFLLTQQEVLDLILSNSIDQGDSNTAWIWDNAGATTITLDGNFGALGNLFDAATYMPEDPNRTWLVTLTNLPNGAYDVLTTKFVVPKADSTNHDIVLTDDCSTISVVADLSAPPLETEEGLGTWSLDWGGLTTDVNGEAWDPLVGDNLVIAHYPGDVAAAEGDFVRLDTASDEYYQLDVFGLTEVDDLSEATDAQGNPFPGFTADGTWLVGITCKTCISPLPLAMAVVRVNPAAE